MAKESSLGNAFLKGLGALVAGLLLFAGEQYIQHHYFADKPQGQPPPPEIIPVAGRVVDAAGTKAIENAVVQLTIGQIHEDQNTDSEGRYAFSLQGFDRKTAASMTIDAQGYKHLSMNLLLSMMGDDKELKLVANTATAPGHAGIGAIVGATWVGPGHGGAATAPPAMVRYARRINPKVIVAHN
jgi:hypothetical protein